MEVREGATRALQETQHVSVGIRSRKRDREEVNLSECDGALSHEREAQDGKIYHHERFHLYPGPPSPTATSASIEPRKESLRGKRVAEVLARKCGNEKAHFSRR
jgi:hypothetical protein